MTQKLKDQQPKLWRIRDPRKLIARGQLSLPGMSIFDSKTADQAWSELVSATSPKRRHHARPNTWPAAKLTGLTGRD